MNFFTVIFKVGEQGWQRFTYQLLNCQFEIGFEVLGGTV